MPRPNVTIFLGNNAHITHLAPVADHLLRQRPDLDVSVIYPRDFMTPSVRVDDVRGRRDLQDEARAYLRGTDIVLTAVPDAPETYGMVEAAIECAGTPVLMYQHTASTHFHITPTAPGSSYLAPDMAACENLLKAGFNAHAVGRPRYDRYAKRDIPGLAQHFRESLPDHARDKNILVLHGEALATPDYDSFTARLLGTLARVPDVFLVYRGPQDERLMRRLNETLGDGWTEDPNTPIDTAMAGGDQHIAHMHPVLNDIVMLNAWSPQPLGIPVSVSHADNAYPFFSPHAGWTATNDTTLEQGLRNNFTELARRRAWVGAKALIGDHSASSRIARVIDTHLRVQRPV